jgi:hypothetical protein
MKVFLRHRRTGHYYRGNLEWVTAREAANDFKSIERALQMIISDKLDGMSLVILWDESGKEQVFDLSSESPQTIKR